MSGHEPALRLHLNLTARCSYQCPYCFSKPGHVDLDIDPLAATCANLTKEYGPCHFHLTGGEPLVHPGILEIVGIIQAGGHQFSMVTNLSAPFEKINSVIATGGQALHRISASFHPTMTSPKAFLDKVTRIKAVLEPPTHILVSMVLAPPNRSFAKPMVKRLDKMGMALRLRPYRVNGSTVPMNLDLKHTIIGNAHYYGRKCWAGARYVWVDVDGKVFRCTNDLLDGVRPITHFGPGLQLLTEALPCTSTQECCIRPETTGLVEKS